MRGLAQLAATILLIAGGALCAKAADLAVLQNGYEIRHEAREVIGETTRLYLRADRTGGYVDVKSDQIVSFERDESVRPTAAALPSAVETSPQVARKAVDVQAAVASASKTHFIDPDLISSVIGAESSFNPKAVSPKGAQGLMQLMPSTASQLGVKDSFDADANVDGGTRYLRELLIRYNDDLAKALAAYNAGPHRVDQYKGVPPYRETRRYVSRIIRDFNRKKTAATATQKANQAGKIKPKSAAGEPSRNHTTDGDTASFGGGN